MIPGEKLTETREFQKAPTAYTLPPPGNGRRGPLPKSWSFVDVDAHGIMRWNPGLETKLALHSIRLHQSLGPAAPVLHIWCSSWPGGQGMSHGGGGGGVTPRGWDLEFTSDWLWHPLKGLFQVKL